MYITHCKQGKYRYLKKFSSFQETQECLQETQDSGFLLEICQGRAQFERYSCLVCSESARRRSLLEMLPIN